MHHSPRPSCHERNRVDSLFLTAVFSCHSFLYIASFSSQAELVPFVTLRYPFFYSPAASYTPSASLSSPSLSTHSLPVPNLQESEHWTLPSLLPSTPPRRGCCCFLATSSPTVVLFTTEFFVPCRAAPRRFQVRDNTAEESLGASPPKTLGTEHDRRDATNVESCTATLYPRECTETRSQSGPEIATQTSASKFVLCKAASSSAIASGFTSSASILIADEL